MNSTAKLFDFPSPDDRVMIDTAVRSFLTVQTGPARDIMLKTIRSVLDKYHITRMVMDDFTVESVKEPGFSVVRARSPVTGNVCPGCGSSIYGFRSPVRILSIKEKNNDGYHYVTYGCRCGRVFAKKEEC